MRHVWLCDNDDAESLFAVTSSNELGLHLLTKHCPTSVSLPNNITNVSQVRSWDHTTTTEEVLSKYAVQVKGRNGASKSLRDMLCDFERISMPFTPQYSSLVSL